MPGRSLGMVAATVTAIPIDDVGFCGKWRPQASAAGSSEGPTVRQSTCAATQRHRAARDVALVLGRIAQRPQVAAFEAMKRRLREDQPQQDNASNLNAARRDRCKQAAQELRRQLAVCRDAFKASGEAAERAILGTGLATASASRHANLGRGLRRPPPLAAFCEPAQAKDGMACPESSQRHSANANGFATPATTASSSRAPALSPGQEPEGTAVWCPRNCEENELWRELSFLVANLGEERPKWAQRVAPIVRRLEASYWACKAERDAMKGSKHLAYQKAEAVSVVTLTDEECLDTRRRVMVPPPKRFVGVHEDGVGVATPPNRGVCQGGRRGREERREPQKCGSDETPVVAEEVIFPGYGAGSGGRLSSVRSTGAAAGLSEEDRAEHRTLQRQGPELRGSGGHCTHMPRTGPPGRLPQPPVPSVQISLLGERGEPVPPRGGARPSGGSFGPGSGFERYGVLHRRGVAAISGVAAREPSLCSSDSSVNEGDEASDSDVPTPTSRPRPAAGSGARSLGSGAIRTCSGSSVVSTVPVPALGRLSERIAHEVANFGYGGSASMPAARSRSHASAAVVVDAHPVSAGPPQAEHGVPVAVTAVPRLALRPTSPAMVDKSPPKANGYVVQEGNVAALASAVTMSSPIVGVARQGSVGNAGGASCGSILRAPSATLFTPRGTASVRGERQLEQVMPEGMTRSSPYLGHQGLSRQQLPQGVTRYESHGAAAQPAAVPQVVTVLTAQGAGAPPAQQGPYTPRQKTNPSLRVGVAGPLRGTQRMASGTLVPQPSLVQHPSLPAPMLSGLAGSAAVRAGGQFRATSSSVSPLRAAPPGPLAHQSVAAPHSRPPSKEPPPGVMAEPYSQCIGASNGGNGVNQDVQRRSIAVASGIPAQRQVAAVPPDAPSSGASGHVTPALTPAVPGLVQSMTAPYSVGGTPSVGARLSSVSGKAYSSTIQLWTPRSQRTTSTPQAAGPASVGAAAPTSTPSGRREVSAEPVRSVRSTSASMALSPRTFPSGVGGAAEMAPAAWMQKLSARR